MVATIDVIMDFGGFDLIHDAVGDHEIVDSPAGVIFPSVEAIAPPRVFDGVGMKVSKGIGKAFGEVSLEHEMPVLEPLLPVLHPKSRHSYDWSGDF